MITRAYNRKKRNGYSIVEVTISVAVLIIISQAFTVFMNNIGRKSVGFQERVWATEKAVAMLDELRSKMSDVTALDRYKDDEFIFRYFLTTKEEVTGGIDNNLEYKTADNYSSGNLLGPHGYLFVRNIRIWPVPNDAKARRVWVRIYFAKDNFGKSASSVPLPQGWVDVDHRGGQVPIAELFMLAHTSGVVDIPTQALDIYLIALESSPGWWVRTASLRDLMASTIANMQIRNPGLEIKDHWIRRMSFGRDLEYTPEVNKNLYANDGATRIFDKTYVYPGKVPYTDASTPELYYTPDWFLARMNVDGAVQRSDSYSVADQFNHAMRLRQEEAFYHLLKSIDANVVPSPGYADEISYRMLLEYMNDPTNSRYLNSIIINLHGEMAPAPPLNNVSYPAKDPVEFTTRYYRAVSHPEKLYFDLAADEPAVSVYAFEMNPATAQETDTINYVTLFFPGLNTGNLKRMETLEGTSKVPYYWKSYTATLTDGKTFAADNFTRIDGTNGLRVNLYNVTATCRAYYGPAHP
jgi:hypothetical protein